MLFWNWSGGHEGIHSVTTDLKYEVRDTKPYIKPYTKPSMFDGLKPGAVVFTKQPCTSGWLPIVFQSDDDEYVTSIRAVRYSKQIWDFRLDNPYLAAPEQPTEKPWIEWKGGEMPVPAGTKVDVKFRAGSQDCRDAKDWYWFHHKVASDIVAYRLA